MATESKVVSTPINGDPSKIVIESTWGLGEALVAGIVRPDRFIVDKGTMQLIHKRSSQKMIEHVPNDETGLMMQNEVPAERRNVSSLTDEQVIEIAKTAVDIEDHYHTAQDIEFALEHGSTGTSLHVVQTRPKTFWSKMKSPTGETDSHIVQSRGRTRSSREPGIARRKGQGSSQPQLKQDA